MRGFPALDFMALMPVAILALGALVLMLSEVFLTSARRGYQAWLTVAFAVIAGGNAVAGAVSGSTGGPIFGGQAVSDGFSTFVTVVVCAGLALSALVGQGWLAARDSERGEFYALALFSAAGMSLLGMATDLLVAFIAIEIMSLATYALAAFVRRGLRPTEAAFKYFLLGAFSSALFLYGAALVYGSTGNLLFSSLRHAQGGLIHLAGVALVVIGVAFKVAAVPFHAWTPDVYEGAPTPVTAFMAAGVKTAAFALLARFFLSTTSAAGTAAPMAIASVVTALALLTMLFGNLLALPQRSVKRMLAYSSIAHAGYLLVGVLAAAAAGAREKALSGILFYLASYTASAIGAFAVVGVIERRGQKDHEAAEPWDLARFSGLAKRRPVLAFVMAIFLFSLAGVPPTAGFIGKLYVFQAAVGAELYGLAIFGVLTSALGAYYYLRVVVFMYMKPAEGAEEGISSTTLSLALGVAAIAVVVLGLGADPIVRLAQLANFIL